ncbi:hypothetical protein FRB91_000028 [Serendipita sp. 411]|nr:hypothetical protein FRC18_007823 [Serendipita sp. 400]KAG8861785.1 hypothetical protein FRB91_000028 [Serendipita sp. 411]
MPPSIIAEPPEGPRSRAKNVIHILFHLWHLFITFLLFLIVVVTLDSGFTFDSRQPNNVHILYLIPLATYNLVFTFMQLFKIDGSRFLPRPLNFGIFARIRFRAYLYQVAAAISIVNEENMIQVIFTSLLWAFGIWTFILGCIASEFGFLDWIQEVQREEEQEEEQQLRFLISSDDEGDEVDLFENAGRRRRDRPRRAKAFVRNVIHVWDLLTILILVPIALVSFSPRNASVDSLLSLYLIPMMIFSAIYALVWLRKKKEDHEVRRAPKTIIKTFLTRFQFGFFSRIRVRGFIYQAFAIIPLSRRYSPEASLAWLVWVSGVAMFVLGCIANECGLLDWVQEEEGQKESIDPVFASSDEEEDEEINVGGHENGAQATGEHPDALHV